MDQQKLEEAEAAFRKAVQSCPVTPARTSASAIAFTSRRSSTKQSPPTAKPSNSNRITQWHTTLGIVLYDQKKWDEAAAAARKAIQLEPRSAHAYNNLGNALGRQKKPDEAVAAFRKAIEIQPNDHLAYHNLGCTLAEQKQFDEAIVAFRKAIELKPDFVKAYPTSALPWCTSGNGMRQSPPTARPLHFSPRTRSCTSVSGTP